MKRFKITLRDRVTAAKIVIKVIPQRIFLLLKDLLVMHSNKPDTLTKKFVKVLHAPILKTNLDLPHLEKFTRCLTAKMFVISEVSRTHLEKFVKCARDNFVLKTNDAKNGILMAVLVRVCKVRAKMLGLTDAVLTLFVRRTMAQMDYDGEVAFTLGDYDDRILKHIDHILKPIEED